MIKVCIKNVINNVTLDEVDKLLSDYISTHNKKFDLVLIKCEFIITLDNFTTNIETNYVHNEESDKIKYDFLYYIVCMKLKGYNFCNINQMIINTLNDRCNMTFNYYTFTSSNILATKINKIIAKNPHLLENTKDILIRKKVSHSI